MSKIFAIMGKIGSKSEKIFEKLKNNNKLNLKGIKKYLTVIGSDEGDNSGYYIVDEKEYAGFNSTGRIISKKIYEKDGNTFITFIANDSQIDLNLSNYVINCDLEEFKDLKDYFGEDTVKSIYIELDDGQRLRDELARERKKSEHDYHRLCERYIRDDNVFSRDNLLNFGVSKIYSNEYFEECLSTVKDYILGEID